MRIFRFLKSLLPKVPEVTERRGFLKGMGALLIAPLLPLPKIPQYDPIILSLIRKAMPNIIAYDICGVQPMTGPTGKIFTMSKAMEEKWGPILSFPDKPIIPIKTLVFDDRELAA